MSITKCKHCDNDYDQDVDVEHMDICKEGNNLTVKVQVSVLPKKRVLIYDEDRSIFWQGKLSREVKKVMNGKLKAYFDASVNMDGKVALNYEVGCQSW